MRIIPHPTTILSWIVHTAIVVLLPVGAGADVPGSPLRFSVRTPDGVTVRGTLHDRGGDVAVIYCHSLLRSGDRIDAVRLLSVLGPRFDLITFDFRGHNSSLGTSTAGGDEILDLHAILGYARGRGYRRVAILGAGMGATVGARAALIFGNVDALVAVSPTGYSRTLTPWIVNRLMDFIFDTPGGSLSARALANTRLERRAHAGYPLDIVEYSGAPRALFIQSKDDRQSDVEELTKSLRSQFPNSDLVTIQGRGHAEKLLDDTVLARVSAFLDTTLSPSPGSKDAGVAPVPAIKGQTPIPAEIARAELEAAMAGGSVARADRNLKDVLSFRGYTLSEVSPVDSTGALNVRTPRIRSIEFLGNRHVSQEYLRSVLNLSGGYFNAYELDAAARRVAVHPAIYSVNETVERNADGDIDVHLRVKEAFPILVFLTAKMTDIDQFYGIGARWNEYNPTGLQLDTRLMYGINGGRLLSESQLGRYTFGGTLFLSAAHYNMIRSRDEVEFVFPRQEVHNIGGVLSARYQASHTVSIEVAAFWQEDREPAGTPVLPITKGISTGTVNKLDIAGRLPLQGPPLLNWRQTLYYKTTTLFDAGDFAFESFQWNLFADMPVTRHVAVATTMHAGRVSGNAPPQELLSIGGMHTFPGYEDDAFVGPRMALGSFGVYFSARKWVDDTSRWAPLRFIVMGHAGTVWGNGTDFDTSRIASDVIFELDYRKIARVGMALPVGGMRDRSEPRVYVGWGEHVHW